MAMKFQSVLCTICALQSTSILVTGFTTTTNQFTKTFSSSKAWMSQNKHRSPTPLQMNLFDDAKEMLTGGKLIPQTSLPYSPPLSSIVSTSDETRTFAVKERPISFTGEDFDVIDASTNSEFVTVRGAMLHLPGKDKMRIYAHHDGEKDEVAVLDRVLVAATPTYDIYRGGMNAEKIGWIEKKLVALTDTFDIYMEGKGGFGVTGLFKPDPAYRISGDFLERNFVMKTGDTGEVVAKISQDGWIQFDAFNHYQVQVAEGMDAVLVMAATAAIDEEYDEEHKERKERLAAD